MRILLVEDDLLLGEGIQDGLIDAGFVVDWFQDGEAGRSALQTEHSFDLVVLDIAMPRLDGLSLLAWIRRTLGDLPVLLLTARDSIEDRITGLDAGADDYLVKPFALGELIARLHALLRRAHGRSENSLSWQGIVLDPAHKIASKDGVSLDLTAMEFKLLHLLMANYPHYLSRSQFDEKLYGWQGEIESNTLDVHLSHLRKKLGSEVIRNVRNLGWRLESN
ncbi:response regulator transcription factor [Deefgea salmonis]|uniref:Response regulator transcription factor n=1 Tax=Deefgea salmonis TaxID=2875502 RepID=A0ABS8BMQ2_9NEIS|nr:response regulator transcription factor [Deefgea salmonis]MCB5197014.1 response regulator transcription factor [Deefgea salmonis]